MKLIPLSGNYIFPNILPWLCFLPFFCYFESFHFQAFIQPELNWSYEWLVTLVLSGLWCWSFLTNRTLKHQFPNLSCLVTLIIFKGFQANELLMYHILTQSISAGTTRVGHKQKSLILITTRVKTYFRPLYYLNGKLKITIKGTTSF